MTYENILAELKQKKYRPIYMLAGEEVFFIDKLTRIFEHEILSDADRNFNQTVVYGKDTDMVSIVAACKQFPMMAPYNVVIVKEAQHLKKWEALEAYAKQPPETTILVFAHKYKTPDKRQKVFKLLKDKHVFFEAKKLYDNQLPAWINDNLRSRNLTITQAAAALLVEQVGGELGKLNNELEKLQLILPSGTQITPQLVEKHIGISKEYNNFELMRAIGKKDILTSNKIALNFAQNPKDNPLVVTVGILYNFFSKLLMVHGLRGADPKTLASNLKVNPYFLKDYTDAAKLYPPAKIVKIISYLRECDTKSKGMSNTSTSDGELLRELLFKILH